MEAPSLSLELPDPERDDISTMEFLSRLEEAWAVCDRFDLQTEIWRGRILRAVRDREKRGVKAAVPDSCNGCASGRSARHGPTA